MGAPKEEICLVNHTMKDVTAVRYALALWGWDDLRVTVRYAPSRRWLLLLMRRGRRVAASRITERHLWHTNHVAPLIRAMQRSLL